MLTALQVNPIHREASGIFNSKGELMMFCPINSVSLNKSASFFKPSFSRSVLNRTQIQKSLICARTKKTGSGSAFPVKLILQSAYFIASKLNMIPEPLHLVMREVGGGDGGGSGFNKDFGWEGFDGRRGRNRMNWFLGFVIDFCFGFWLVWEKNLSINEYIGSLFLSLFATCGKINMKECFLSFCSCAFMMFFGMRSDKLKNWTKGFRSADIMRRGKRRRKRRFWSLSK